MKSLYINTTEKFLSLAFKDGDKYYSFESDGSRSQSEEIFLQIEKILHGNKISDLDFVVCLGGPGSFTGIRLGLSVVKGFNIAVDIPVIVIDNFMAVFYSLDEKVKEFYVSLPAGEREIFAEKLSENGDVLEPGKLLKKDEFKPYVRVFDNVKINPLNILLNIEKKFDAENFMQQSIKPTYIKPHYAKVKAK